jgi:cytochrome c oxidase cbb3-type subunit III
MTDHQKPEKDHVTGVETTGHEWDGIKELNNPAPRWWLWVFYVTVIWSVGYWVLYPAWPTLSGHTKGHLEWNQYKKLEQDQAEITKIQEAKSSQLTQIKLQDIETDPELYAFAVAGGQASYKENCAMCHGSGGQGAPGYPNLNDDDWLWGGTLQEIHATIQHGIRAKDGDTRLSEMPAFGQGGLLNRQQIDDVVNYILKLSGQMTEGQAAKIDTASGQATFVQNCASCHDEDGKGNQDLGAPNLTDKIWLYGGDRQAIYNTIYNSRKGVMPNWNERLSEETIRQLAVYIHSLGGGEAEPTPALAPVEPAADGAVPASDEANLDTPIIKAMEQKSPKTP